MVYGALSPEHKGSSPGSDHGRAYAHPVKGAHCARVLRIPPLTGLPTAKNRGSRERAERENNQNLALGGALGTEPIMPASGVYATGFSLSGKGWSPDIGRLPGTTPRPRSASAWGGFPRFRRDGDGDQAGGGAEADGKEAASGETWSQSPPIIRFAIRPNGSNGPGRRR